jgi:hypothetical protein
MHDKFVYVLQQYAVFVVSAMLFMPTVYHEAAHAVDILQLHAKHDCWHSPLF